MTNRPSDLPPLVTFATGAALLRRLNIDPKATAASVRYLARKRGKDWAFGDCPGQVGYERMGNARAMDTTVFLDHIEKHPPNPRGRGRDKRPRVRTAGPP